MKGRRSVWRKREREVKDEAEIFFAEGIGKIGCPTKENGRLLRPMICLDGLTVR